jgi:hypothetical protein
MNQKHFLKISDHISSFTALPAELSLKFLTSLNLFFFSIVVVVAVVLLDPPLLPLPRHISSLAVSLHTLK